MTRDRTIYVSSKVYWLLIRLVRAQNAKASEREAPLTTDALLDVIVSQWVQLNHPKLLEVYTRREALNEEAEKLL